MSDFKKNECINREIFSSNPSAELILFEIYDIANTTDVIRFHGGVNNFSNKITFDSKDYFYIPYSADNFGTRADGSLSRPTIDLINFEGIFSRYIKNKDDLIGSKVKRIRTFLRFIDEVNFLNYSSDKAYWGKMGIDPNPGSKLRDEIWIINQKVSENKNLIRYELSSALDLENVKVPRRQIINNYCTWKYRGKGCLYSGSPCADSNDVVFTGTLINKGEWAEGINYQKNDFVFIEIKDGSESRNSVFVCIEDHKSDEEKKPSVSHSLWAQDACSKTLSGCKLRFKPNSHSIPPNNPTKHLPFGGFPGSRLF